MPLRRLPATKGTAEKGKSIKVLFREAEERRLSGVEREQRRLSAVECASSSELHPYWVEHLRISLGAGNSRARLTAYLDAMETLLVRGDGLPPDEEFGKLANIVRKADDDLATRAFGVFRRAAKMYPAAAAVEKEDAGSGDRRSQLELGLRVNKRAWEPTSGSRRRDEQSDYDDDADTRIQRTSSRDEWQRFVYTLRGVLASLDGDSESSGADTSSEKAATHLGHRLFFMHAASCILEDLSARTAVFDSRSPQSAAAGSQRSAGNSDDLPLLLDSTLCRLLESASGFAAGPFSRATGFFELLIGIIAKVSAGVVDSDIDATMSADDMREAAAGLIRGAMTLFRRLEEAGAYTDIGKRVSRNTGRNMRVEVDKEISDRVRNLRQDFEKLAVLRELTCPETKLRIVCRILSERTSTRRVPDVHRFLSSIGASESCNAWRKYVLETCMSDFFTYTSEHTTEAVKCIESVEFLVVLFTQAVLGILMLACAEEELEHNLLEKLAELDTAATIDRLLCESQDAFSVFELESLRMIYAHRRTR